MPQSFDEVAEFYETVFDYEMRLNREAPLLTAALDAAPGKRVADLACGTGPHAVFYAEQGAQVDAFDLSPEMIAFAQDKRPHAAVRYCTGDMRDPQGGPWDLAICLGNSLSLLPDRDAVGECMNAVVRALNPGGVFLVQVLNYARSAMQVPQHKVIEKGAVTAVKSFVPQGEHTLLSLSFFAPSDDTYAAFSENAVLLSLRWEELEGMAQAAGLTVDAVYGGFDRQPFAEATSPDCILVLRRL